MKEEHYLPDGRFVRTSDGKLAYFLGKNDYSDDIFLLPTREDGEIYFDIFGGILSKKGNEFIFHPWIEYELEIDFMGLDKIMQKLKLFEKQKNAA